MTEHTHTWEWDYHDQWYICRRCPEGRPDYFTVIDHEDLLALYFAVKELDEDALISHLVTLGHRKLIDVRVVLKILEREL